MKTKWDPSEPKKKGKKLSKTIIKEMVFDRARKRNHIITGSRAMNMQLPKKYRRAVDDVDVWAPSPWHHMDLMEDRLDKKAGGDRYHERVLEMPNSIGKRGGFKKIFQVVDNITNKSVLDYSKPVSRARTIKQDKLRWEHIQHIKKKCVAILNDPRVSQERKAKVRKDLNRINRGIR